MIEVKSGKKQEKSKDKKTTKNVANQEAKAISTADKPAVEADNPEKHSPEDLLKVMDAIKERLAFMNSNFTKQL